MRSVLAISVGFVVWSVIWLGSYPIASSVSPESFRGDSPMQTTGIAIVFIFVSIICSGAAGCATAKLSKTSSARNVMILAAILLAVGLFVEVSNWALSPVWYHLLFLVLLIPTTIAGGKLGKS
jgi:hypothetical protein